RAGARLARAQGRADDPRQGGRLGADEVDVARHVRARLLRDRDDVDRLRALRHRALRDGGLPLLAAAGRPPDRLRPRVEQDGCAAAADLRPDARAEVGDRDGRLRELGRDVQQLRDRAVGRQDHAGRHLRARLPAAAVAADGGNHPPARGRAGRSAARVRDPERRHVTFEGVPGLVETVEEHGETTLVVDPARVAEAGLHLRDAEGFNFLSDISAADYLGWGARGVSGYIGNASGRDLNAPMTQGYQSLPKPRR